MRATYRYRLFPTKAQRTALQAASVLGQQFPGTAVAHMLGWDLFDPAPLTRQRLIGPCGDGFIFAHALVRDAVYDTLLKSRRRELHRAAAGCSSIPAR